MAPANSGPREHLDYDQIDFKIRSKTVKDYEKLKACFDNISCGKRKPEHSSKFSMCMKLLEQKGIFSEQ